MKTLKKTKKFILLVMCLCISLVAVPAFAGSASGSINIKQLDNATKKPVAGIKLTIYKVAEPAKATEAGFKVTDEFASLNIPVGDLGEAKESKKTVQELNKFIEDNSIGGIETKVTDANGMVQFGGLEDGIYFIKQTNTAADFKELGYVYETESYLIGMPHYTSGSATRVVNCQPKGKLTKGNPENTNLVVYKVWNDHNNKYDKRPESISVGLYGDNNLVETVELSAVNNWHYEWNNIDTSKTWTVKEMKVPEGYTPKVSLEGNAFTIKNTYKPEKPGKIIKTGDESKYIGLAALIALCAAFGVASAFRRRKS